MRGKTIFSRPPFPPQFEPLATFNPRITRTHPARAHTHTLTLRVMHARISTPISRSSKRRAFRDTHTHTHRRLHVHKERGAQVILDSLIPLGERRVALSNSTVSLCSQSEHQHTHIGTENTWNPGGGGSVSHFLITKKALGSRVCW